VREKSYASTSNSVIYPPPPPPFVEVIAGSRDAASDAGRMCHCQVKRAPAHKETGVRRAGRAATGVARRACPAGLRMTSPETARSPVGTCGLSVGTDKTSVGTDRTSVGTCKTSGGTDRTSAGANRKPAGAGKPLAKAGRTPADAGLAPCVTSSPGARSAG
jgi:hypothetical protein